MRVAWLSDDSWYMGGAEIVCRDLLAAKPDSVDVIEVEPSMVPDADVYVLHNIVTYGEEIIDGFRGKPVIKQVHDMWPAGNAKLRDRLLSSRNVTLLFSSNLHRTKFPWKVSGPTCVIAPPGIDCKQYVRPARSRVDAAVWVGRMERGKGINRAIQWSRQTGTKLDFYGYGSQLEQVPRSMFRGALDPEEVPEILSMYSTFVFLPDLPEPFGRTAVEAGLAGCTLILNGNVGATDWMGNCQAIRESCDAFWNLILSKVKVRGRR